MPASDHLSDERQSRRGADEPRGLDVRPLGADPGAERGRGAGGGAGPARTDAELGLCVRAARLGQAVGSLQRRESRREQSRGRAPPRDGRPSPRAPTIDATRMGRPSDRPGRSPRRQVGDADIGGQWDHTLVDAVSDAPAPANPTPNPTLDERLPMYAPHAVQLAASMEPLTPGRRGGLAVHRVKG